MTENLPSQVAIVGLGYVGLPLATAFSKVLPTIGFDINQDRIAELRNGSDRNGEIDRANLRDAVSGTYFRAVPIAARISHYRCCPYAGGQS